MTLDEAVAILNRERHRGAGHSRRPWYVSGEGPDALVLGADHYDSLEPFEAVAIAEAYLKLARETAGAHLRRPLD